MFDDERHHHHDHSHADHDHGHEEAGTGIVEAPLDPANQSLADALRASFWVLKAIMLVVLVCFVVSGVFIVDEKEVAVRTTFGAIQGSVCKPGLQWGWPYPVGDVQRVSTAPKNLRVEDFWLRLREEEKTKDLDQLSAPRTGLDPAIDGALLTGDKAIMHASFKVQYKIPEVGAKEYVSNVKDEEALLRSVIKQAAVAEAARIPATVVWRDPGTLANAVRTRAQKELDALNTGIQIENVVAPESHYPLQTSSEFLAVNNAENRQRATINEANTERENKLNGAAGLAWEKINAEVERLDQVKDDSERQAIFKAIGEILLTQAKGEAGGKVQLARRDREQIVNDTLAEVSEFDALREEYRRNPDLIRLRLNQLMRDKLFSSNGLVKWILPPDDKNIVLWMAKDPKESAEEARRRMEEATKKKK